MTFFAKQHNVKTRKGYSMPLGFGFGKKTPGRRRRKTQSIEEKTNKLLTKKYYEVISSDEEALRAAVSKKFNVELPVPNPLAQKRREIQGRYWEKAATMIDSNPELSNRMTESLVDQIIDTKDNVRQRRNFVDILSEFKGTAQRLGYKNDADLLGLVAAALQALPEVNVFLRTIMEQRGQAPQTLPSQVSAAQAIPCIQPPELELQVTDVCVLMPDGSERRMSSAEYVAWKQEQEAARQAMQAGESLPTESAVQKPQPGEAGDTLIRP